MRKLLSYVLPALPFFSLTSLTNLGSYGMLPRWLSGFEQQLTVDVSFLLGSTYFCSGVEDDQWSQEETQFLDLMAKKTLPPTIFEVENGWFPIWVSFRAIFHFHDYGRKGSQLDPKTPSHRTAQEHLAGSGDFRGTELCVRTHTQWLSVNFGGVQDGIICGVSSQFPWCKLLKLKKLWKTDQHLPPASGAVWNLVGYCLDISMIRFRGWLSSTANRRRSVDLASLRNIQRNTPQIYQQDPVL